MRDHSYRHAAAAAASPCSLVPACKKEAAPVAYQAVAGRAPRHRVSAQASGTIQPDTTVEVKSKASGEILD